MACLIFIRANLLSALCILFHAFINILSFILLTLYRHLSVSHFKLSNEAEIPYMYLFEREISKRIILFIDVEDFKLRFWS